ncbi:MAG: BamA/TamA family outer membrane protein, partial [Nitrospirae bacterium]|nr:BamA/TamA family outer membrane protein [Nitrospirota bacterium]
MKLHKGDYYSEREMDQSIQALERHYIDKGYLKILIRPPELVYDEAKGEVLLTLSIEAGPHVDVLFEGAETMAPEALKKELLIWKEKAFDSSVLDESADRLTQFYRSRGYHFAAITYRIDKSNDRNLRIVFKITEGIPVTVREVEFIGNHYFSSKVLKEYLDIKAGGVLIEDVLKEDIKEMTTLYKNSGFLEIKLAPDILFHEGDKTLGIRITVEEGIQTFLARMEVSGNNTFSREEIMGHSKSREGHPYNESQVIDDLYSIQSFYVQKGYLYASVDLKSRYSPDKKEVMIDYVITEDKPVYIGETYVSGHSVTREYVIRRELLIKEGDLYSYENILRSQRRLLSLGIFKGIKLEPMNPEVREYRKDMSLKVEEGYPGTVEFGIGYGDVEKMRGMFEASYRNLFGTGRQTTLRVEGSSIEQKYSLGYKEPWVLGYQMDARINMVDQIENKRSFDRRTLGFSTGIDKSFSDYVKGSLMYQYEDVRLSDVSAEAILTPEDTGKVEVATINPSITIDRRDDPFNPSRGTFSSIAFREAA